MLKHTSLKPNPHEETTHAQPTAIVSRVYGTTFFLPDVPLVCSNKTQRSRPKGLANDDDEDDSSDNDNIEELLGLRSSSKQPTDLLSVCSKITCMPLCKSCPSNADALSSSAAMITDTTLNANNSVTISSTVFCALTGQHVPTAITVSIATPAYQTVKNDKEF